MNRAGASGMIATHRLQVRLGLIKTTHPTERHRIVQGLDKIAVARGRRNHIFGRRALNAMRHKTI